MPGIRRAEHELEQDEATRVRQMQKEEKSSAPAGTANDPRFAPVEGL